MKNKLIVVPLLAWLGLLNFHLTTSAQPVVTTLAASGVTATNAALNGSVNPNGVATTAYFRYGLTTNYGSFSATNNLTATNTALAVSNLIGSLIQGSTYHFQLMASNSAGTALGADLAFTTLALAPVVTTLPATSITLTNATLHGTVNPNGGATTAYFQYGLTTNYGYVGGYTLLPATNATLTLPGLLASLPGAAGENWTQSSAPVGDWQAISSSADGTRLVAGIYPGGIYFSTNSGGTWTQSDAPVRFWGAIASSADGSKLVAADSFPSGFSHGDIWTSTNSGVTWTQSSAPTSGWIALTSSADGSQLAAINYYPAGSNNGGIWISMNSGVTWTQSSAPTNGWRDLTSSADGSRLAAVVFNGGIYTSTNSGIAWTQTSAPDAGWNSIASSADGTVLAAATYTAGSSSLFTRGIWISTDGGATWTRSSTINAHWLSIASSADGSRLAAAAYNVGFIGGGIYTSTNSGLTWAMTSASNAAWESIASSADGTRLAAVVNGGGIWTSTGTGSGLTPGTVYHYRVVGINGISASFGSDLTFTTSPIAPLVSTLAAGGISATAATLNGAVNPFGAATTAYFRYGSTTNYGSFSATNSLPATNATLLVSNLITGLSPATTYHYQLVGSNSVGTSLGADRTFTTTFFVPAAATLAASGVTATNAILNGTVNPNGDTATAYFQFGLTTNYGSFSATNSLAATNTTLAVSNLISSLAPGTIYHFRIVGMNSGGANFGVDQTFTTGFPAPVVATLAASGVTATTATLNGTVNPNGAATMAYFQYGLTTNYGSFSATNGLPATNTTLAVSNLISSLAPGAVYHFQIVGVNSGGTSLGVDRTFTNSLLAPTVATLAASGVTATNATLNGTVNPNGAITTAYFQYGLTTNYGSFSATNTLAATNATLAVSNLIGSLAPGAIYHFRLVASNSVGSAFGADYAFGVFPHAFTGASPGQGLDLQGTFPYAVNVGTNGAPGLIGDANLTADNVAGVSITAPGNTLKSVNAWANPNFGASTDALRLAQAMSSMRWTSVPGILTVNLDGLQVGHSYQLQLMFIESSTNRVFDVSVNGSLIVPAFRLLDYGPLGTAIVIPYLFTATDTNALIQLGGGTGGSDNNPTLSAFTLEVLAPAVTTLAASGITRTNAILNGTVNPDGVTTAVYFQYGLTTNYGSYSATNNLPATNATLAVSNQISNLLPGTTYHFRMVGVNSGGTALGADRTFTTVLPQALTFNLTASIVPPVSALQLRFTNLSGLGFTVLSATNAGLPMSNWTVLGAASESPPGQYQFTDMNPMNVGRPVRFYRVRSP